MTNVTISEYGYIGCDKISTNSDKFVGKRDLEPLLFQELYDFWLQDEDTQKVLSFKNQQCLKAINYVGVIQTRNLSLEILPKIYKDREEDKYRDIFIEMLKPLLGINELHIDRANLSTIKNKNIYEIFITLFIEYVDNLIHKGLKADYISEENNQYFLKGKLKFNEHIKQNSIRKERFYVEFDEYKQDRVENRLLKSAIELLLKKSSDFKNKKALRQQLFIFDEVKVSHHYKVDFSKINLHRGMEYYEIPLRFAKVFLLHESFTALRGKNDVFALLFPMEKVFENYMEFVLKNSKEALCIKQVLINGGKNEYLLENKMARLQPDYLLKMKKGKDIICDAKWKLLENSESKINISSNDVYQVFAYHHFYEARDTAYVFVPDVDEVKNIVLKYTDSDKKIRIFPIDLEKIILNEHRIQNFH